MSRLQARFRCHAHDNVRGAHSGEREGLHPSSSIYVNSEQCWHFSIREEQSGLARAAIGMKYRLNQMAKLEMSIPGLTVRSSKVGHIMRQAFAGLVYLGIIAAFASVAFIAWLSSLVIW